jgi:MerR family transcriptional regulator, light-induced transcriptional regulator
VVSRDQRLELLQQTFADALVRGHEQLASEAISEAIDLAFDEGEIDDYIVTPALRMVGDLWARGELGIADEHLATEISLRVITLQREAFRVARRRALHRILLAAVEGEQHVVGLRMAASLALHAGFDVRLLGPDLPVHALLAAVSRHDPSVVCLTATMPASAARLLEAVETVGAAAPDVGLLIGGAAVDRRFELLSGVTVCRHVSDVVGRLEALVQRAPTN